MSHALLAVGEVFTADLEAMREKIEVQRGVITALREEVDIQRKLAKYGRRTWFEVLAWVFLGGLLVSDLGQQYCTAPSPYGEACNVVFWTTDHGASDWWRVLGFLLVAALLTSLAYRSQVPPELAPRSAFGADLQLDENGRPVDRGRTWWSRRRRE
jgi:hypothetical protein